MDLFDQCDIFGDVEIGEQGCLLAYRYDVPGVQSMIIMLEGLVVLEEFYSDCSSNDSTSMAKMAMKSLTMPLSTEMGMSVIA